MKRTLKILTVVSVAGIVVGLAGALLGILLEDQGMVHMEERILLDAIFFFCFLIGGLSFAALKAVEFVQSRIVAVNTQRALYVLLLILWIAGGIVSGWYCFYHVYQQSLVFRGQVLPQLKQDIAQMQSSIRQKCLPSYQEGEKYGCSVFARSRTGQLLFITGYWKPSGRLGVGGIYACPSLKGSLKKSCGMENGYIQDIGLAEIIQSTLTGPNDPGYAVMAAEWVKG